MKYPEHVKIVEVGPRDGLQNENATLPVEQRVRLVELLAECGLRAIEFGSFVSPKWVPQMAHSAEVFAGISQRPGVSYVGLVPNLRGFEDAAAAGVREIAIFASASESFSQANINCSIDESFERFAPIVEAAPEHGIAVRGYVSCCLGCPYEGEVSLEAVARVVGVLQRAGCYEVSLGDTIGVGAPKRVQAMLQRLGEDMPMDRLAVHFHDTYGQSLANILMSLQMGISVVDCSVAGLGGCPYAPSASGNVATEDVLYMLEGLGIETGVDLRKVAETGWLISAALGKSLSSKVSKALRTRYAKEGQRHQVLGG